MTFGPPGSCKRRLSGSLHDRLRLIASVLGAPDIGLMTLTEMATHAKNMAAALDVPLIADADTGYGGILNIRTVQEYERGGVSGVSWKMGSSKMRSYGRKELVGRKDGI